MKSSPKTLNGKNKTDFDEKFEERSVPKTPGSDGKKHGKNVEVIPKLQADKQTGLLDNVSLKQGSVGDDEQSFSLTHHSDSDKEKDP